MASTLHPISFRTVSPRPSRTSLSASVSPSASSRASPRRPTSTALRSSESSKENIDMSSSSPRSSTRANGKSPVEKDPTRVWRDGSLELSDDNEGNSARRSTRPVKSTAYDRLPTLPTIPDPDTTEMGASTSKPPPPAPSTALAKTGSERIERPGTRKRRSSSIKRKLSPGVTPTTVVDWEIPRKALHSSIGECLASPRITRGLFEDLVSKRINDRACDGLSYGV